jgi:hypothetical protein
MALEPHDWFVLCVILVCIFAVVLLALWIVLTNFAFGSA